MSDLPRDGSTASGRLQGVLAAALDCIICMDRDGLVQEFNPAAERTFGFKREDVLGKELADLIIPPEFHEQHRRGLAHFLASGEGRVLGRRIEVPALRADRSRIAVELAITVVTDQDGPFFTAYLRDVTERRQVEKRRAAQYAIANLLSGAEDIRYIGERVLAILAEVSNWTFGALWLQTIGSSEIENVAQWHEPQGDYTDFEDATMQLKLTPGVGLPGKVMASGEPMWIADVRVDEDFPRRAAAARADLCGGFAFPLRSGGRILGAVELFGPAAIEPDDDLLPLTAALGSNIGQFIERQHAQEEMLRQKHAAEAANAAKDRFLATLSHELRTPLTPVLMWADAALEERALSPELTADVEMIRRNIDLEARLIDDLLDLTRIGYGKMQFEKRLHDLHRLIRHAAESVAQALEHRELNLRLELGAARSMVLGDAVRLQQVIWNLLRNACKFTPAKGTITVRTADEGADSVRVEVSDTGVGMSREQLQRIFDPFEQAGRERAGGLGLGLAISKSLIQMHGGTLEARSSGADQGSTLVITLRAESPGPVAPATDDTTLPLVARHLRILVVEDHDSTATILSRVLRRMGHEVRVAGSVQAAMKLLARAQIDLLISDVGLPDGSGFDVVTEAHRERRLPAIALSGYGQPEDIRRSLAAGFDAHLTKPIELDRLKRIIGDVAARH